MLLTFLGESLQNLICQDSVSSKACPEVDCTRIGGRAHTTSHQTFATCLLSSSDGRLLFRGRSLWSMPWTIALKHWSSRASPRRRTLTKASQTNASCPLPSSSWEILRLSYETSTFLPLDLSHVLRKFLKIVTQPNTTNLNLAWTRSNISGPSRRLCRLLLQCGRLNFLCLS